MNVNTTIGRKLHDAIARMPDTAPGRQFAHRLKWCEEYLEGEMAFDADFDNEDRAVKSAINAGRREGWR